MDWDDVKLTKQSELIWLFKRIISVNPDAEETCSYRLMKLAR